jgi:hypothetical protein
MRHKLYKIMILAFIAAQTGCGVYSFTGASIPPGVKTISIGFIPNQSNLVIGPESQQLTQALKDKFQSSTNLSVINSDGDWDLQGTISSTAVTPDAPTGGSTSTASLNRLTITVSMTFTNNKDTKQNWTQAFSYYSDFDATKNLSDVQNSLITTINTQIVQDIFNKAAVNW